MEMVSVGTMIAYMMVAVSVLVFRYHIPEKMIKQMLTPEEIKEIAGKKPMSKSEARKAFKLVRICGIITALHSAYFKTYISICMYSPTGGCTYWPFERTVRQHFY